MADWEDEDFEPVLESEKTDKWDGEDEDNDVKDNWEEDDEKKLEGDDPKSTTYQKPKKKPLAERIAEKDRAKKEASAPVEKKELTSEEKLSEKIRLQRVQEEADAKLAKEIFGVKDDQAKGIDSMLPETKEEFDEFSEALKKKITFFEPSKLYGDFAEKLINELSLTLPVENIKKIGLALNSLYHEKDRQRKEQAKSKKKKGKVFVKLDRADDMGLADVTGQYEDDGEDFI